MATYSQYPSRDRNFTCQESTSQIHRTSTRGLEPGGGLPIAGIYRRPREESRHDPERMDDSSYPMIFGYSAEATTLRPIGIGSDTIQGPLRLCDATSVLAPDREHWSAAHPILSKGQLEGQ
jgi:hypothetical protein